MFEDVQGWTEELHGARTLDDLPAAARAYVDLVSELAGAPVRTISVGPERVDTVEVR